MKKTYLLLQLLFINSIIYAQDSCQEIVNSIANSSHTPTLIFDPVSGDSLIYYNLCLGDQLSLVADATFPENNTIYTQSLSTTEFTWLTNNIDTFSGQEFINTFTTGGIYEIALTATDVNDCENTVPFTIFVSVSSIEHTISSSTHSPTFGTDSLTGDTIIYYDLCIGEELTLVANATFPNTNISNPQSLDSTQFTWYLDNVEISTELEYTNTYTTSGGFIINITSENTNGCVNTLPYTVYVRVSTLPTINLSANPSLICPDVESFISNNPSADVNIPDDCSQAIGSATIEGFGGLEPYTYSWPTLGFSGQTASNLNSGTYPYTITDAQGCVYEGVAIVDQISLEVELELFESSDDICELGYGEMLVTPISGNPPYSYNWANSNSTSALGTNLFKGLQTVVATDVNGCTGDFSYFIGNIPPPEAEFSYYLDSCTFELTLTDETAGAIYSHWKIGTNLTSSQTTTSLYLNPGLTYPITLISSTEYCSDSVVQIVDLTLSSLLNRIKFPNVFTPNNDLINDYFTINGLNYCDKGSLRIFNRWGEEVYYTLHPHREPWNGKKLGLGVSEGAYFYVLDLSYTKLKGVLNLYR